jgi:cholesterol oxidase
MAVAQGRGRRRSLIYANISAVPMDVFDAGWPREITWQEMAPHYETVGDVMNVLDIGPTNVRTAPPRGESGAA